MKTPSILRQISFAFLLCGLLSAVPSPSRGSTFWATYGGPGSLGASSIAKTLDGGYFVAGGMAPAGAGATNAWVLRLDGKGTVLWENTYGGTADDYVNSVQSTPDGGCVVAGYTSSFGAGGCDAWVLKIDGQGAVLWQNAYGGAGYDFAASVQPTPDGGYLVAGGTDSWGTGQTEVWIFKLDQDGNILWDTRFGDAGVESVSSIQVTSDGGIVVAGGAQSSGAGDYDALVIRLDGSGNPVWQKTYGGIDYDFASSVRETADGGFVVVGETLSFGAGSYDLFVFKIDATGKLIWQKTYGGTGDDSAHSVQTTADGGFVIAGGTRSSSTGDDVLVLRLDANGGLRWQKTYGGTENDIAHFVDETDDGGLVVAGETRSFGAGDYDFFVLRLDGSGALGGTCAAISKAASLKAGTPAFTAADGTLTPGAVVATTSATTITPQATSAMTQACVFDINTLTQVSPNGGEKWAAGSTQTIKWTYTGNPGSTVKIELIKGGGAPVSIADSTPIGSSGSGSYAWALASSLTAGTDYRVQVTAGTYSDTSAADFTVAPAPTITLTSPNGGETWAAGSTRSIAWTTTGNPGATVKVELIKTGRTPVTLVKSTSAGTGGSGSYPWKIPTTQVPGTDYRVKVTSTTYPAATDTSDADFTVDSTLALIAPNGGEKWTPDSTQTIKWTYTGNPGATVKIDLIKGGGAPVSITDSTPIGSSGSGSFTWALPSSLTAGADYRIQITAGTCSDTSAADFTVDPTPTITLTSPNGGETWAAGSTRTVTWTYTGNPGATVKVELIKAVGTPVTLTKSTKTGTGGSGSYAWKISATQVPGTDYRVQVTSTAYPAVTDTSDADFTVDSTLTLTAPNGGEKWTPGSTQTIKWAYTGDPGATVKIDLIKGGGAPVSITDSTPVGSSGSGSYDWALPSSLAAGTNYRIQITAGTCSDTSAADFTVDPTPTITLTSPNGGEAWVAGSTRTVTWTYTDNPGATVKVELVKAVGTPVTLTKSTKTGTGGSGSYAWKIPATQAPGTDYRVQVTSTAYPAVTDTSDADFTVDSTLTLTAPNGGESWTAGSAQVVKWTYTGNPGATVKIELIEGGGTPVSITDSTPVGSSGSGSYAWALPSSLTPGADYRVQITAGTYSDTSAADFTVAPAPTLTLTAPNGGETWAAGSTRPIAWTTTGNPGATVKVELIKAGGAPVTLVKSTAAGTGGSGSYAWKIPTTQAPGADYRVKVTSTAYPDVTDTSDSDFTVDSTLTLTAPIGGESWTAGSTQVVKWSYTGNPGATVKVDLIKGGGALVALTDSTPIGSSGSGSYAWAIPSAFAAGADYRIKVTTGTYSDTSAADFTVAPAPTITLTAPNRGEIWAAGSTQSIAWTYTGNPGATVKVELIKAGGTSVTLVKSTSVGTGGSGSYAWKVPTTQAPGADYRVKVTSTAYPSVTDTSDANFTVDSTLTLTAPNGGETWTAGSTQIVKWTYTGNPGTTAKIELIMGGGTPVSITDSTPVGSSGSGSYSWVLPLALGAGADYRVQVTVGACSDTSAADFTVAPAPTITLTSPNGGETWAAGSTQSIAWTTTGNPGATVKVELIKAGGAPVTLVKSTSAGTGGSGSYAWKIPTTQAPGTDHRVKVTSTAYPDVTDTSDSDFTVDSTLTLTAPIGGESWTAGSAQVVKWTYTGNPGATVKIELIKGGGAPVSITDSTPVGSSGSGSYAWALPSSLTASADYRVQVTAGTYSDTSDADFTVAPAPTITLISPNGGETWAAGSTRSIAWTYTGNPGGTVKVELIKAGGTPVILSKSTAAGTGGSGSYAWKIPTTQAPGTDYRVKVTSTAYPAVTDTSDADFTVDSTLTLTAPNGGETWTAGSTQVVKWTYTGNPGTTVKIELIKGGRLPVSITDSTPIGSSGSGSYTWILPLALTSGADYRLKVAAGACSDVSAADLTVGPAPTITVTSPNGGETWAAGSTHTITWTTTGNPGTTVKVELIKGIAAPVSITKSVATGVSGKGTYTWKIPSALAPGGDYRVRVTSLSNGGITDTSDGDLTINWMH